MAVDRSSAHQGETVRLRMLFQLSGTTIDPHEIRLVQILDANQNLLAEFTGAEIVREELGIYYVDWPIPQAEPATIHHDRWYATAFDGGTEEVFPVSFQVLTFGGNAADTPYLTLAEARAYIPEASTITDAELAENVLLGQDLIELITGLSFLPRAESRTFDGSGRAVLSVKRAIQTVSSVEVLGCDSGGVSSTINVDTIRISGSRTMLAIGNVQRHSDRFRSWGVDRYPWQWGDCGVFPAGFQNIVVTGAWGEFNEVPRPIKRALGQLLRYTCLCDDPVGMPTAAFASESTPGDRSYSMRKIWTKASIDNGTGFADVDSILSLYGPGIIVGTV